MWFQLLLLISQYVLKLIWCLKLGHSWNIWLFFWSFKLSLLWSCLIHQPWCPIGRCLRALGHLAAVLRSIPRRKRTCSSWGTSNSIPVSWSFIIGRVSYYLINVVGIQHILFEILAQLYDVGLCLFLMLLWYSVDVIKQLRFIRELILRHTTSTMWRSLSLRSVCSKRLGVQNLGCTGFLKLFLHFYFWWITLQDFNFILF